MEAEISRKSDNEVTDNLNTRMFNPTLIGTPILPAGINQLTATNQTVSYTIESVTSIESDEVTECRCTRVFNSSLNVSTAFTAELESFGNPSRMPSHKMDAEVIIESTDEVLESLDAQGTFQEDIGPPTGTSHGALNTSTIEADNLIESKEEVTEHLDARVYNPPLTVLPAVPQDIGPSTSSSQSSSTEHSTGNPDSQKGWLFPSAFKPSPIFNKTPPTTQIAHPNPQKGFLYPTPTTLQPPPPKVAPPRFQIAHYFPNKDASSYELEKFKQNRMIIFDHERFFSGPSRPGTAKDEKLLRETFQKYRFNIDPTYKNLEASPLLETVKNFALRTNFSAYGCICVAILTHGHKEPGFLKAYDRRYSEYDIFKHFDASKNPTLAAKPIIFIIQAIKSFECVGWEDDGGIEFNIIGMACRGSLPSPKVNTGGKTPAPQLDHGEEGETYHLPTEADRIVFHSSYVGKASVRDPTNGSWFIQTLCKKIEENALSHDVETIFRQVRRAVALDCDTEEDWKQMPVVTSTTLRELYLAPNPQRRDEKPRPVSPYVLVCQINNPDVYPLSHQLAERLKDHLCLIESSDTAPVPGTSSALMQLHHLPCCCFVEYFEYLKSCLETYTRHNEEDLVAKSLLKLVERTGSGSEYNLQKFSYIQSMWEHFDTNKNKFPPDGFSFVHRMYAPKEPDMERLEPL